MIRLDPVGQPHVPLLARVRARTCDRASCTAIGSRARSIRRSGMRFDPDQGSPRSLRPRRRGSRDLRSRRRARPGRQRRDGDEERGRRRLRLRLGRRRAAAAALRRGPSSTRCTCAASPAIRAPALATKTRGTFAGLIEKIPYLQRLGITAVELLPVFQFDAQDCPPGLRQLLGLCAGVVLRAAPGLQLAAGSARSRRRVSRHGQGAAPRRHRGHSRRRVQPHRRRRPPRADAELPRTGQRDVLHPRSRIARATRTTAAPGTRSTPTIPSSGG